jgi:hypothetical protein
MLTIVMGSAVMSRMPNSALNLNFDHFRSKVFFDLPLDEIWTLVLV